MRNFLPDITTAIEAEEVTTFFLLELQFTAATYRLTDLDCNVIYDSETFSPQGFRFDSISGNASLAVESMDIEIDDTDQTLTAAILNEDVRNKTAILTLGVQTSSGFQFHDLVQGIIGGWELRDENVLVITITNELILWNKKPLRIQSSSCPWVFKGTECAYAGAGGSCDKTYKQCLTYGNQANFGGDRFVSALMKRQIWWGKEPKS